MDKKAIKILILDDDRMVCQSLKLLLTKANFEVQTIGNPLNALEFIEQFQPNLIILDMNFTIDTSGKQGLNILQKIRDAYEHLPIILITGWASMELAIQGMKMGAQDFIAKPWDNQALLSSIDSILALNNPESSQLSDLESIDNIIGHSPSIQEVKNLIVQVAPTDATVLITGESGTGKELVAEAIHDLSRRQENPFVKVNLGGLTSSLFESELFGHKKGAFTGAIENRIGRFEMAENGTIFLDEVGDLALDLQVKLLRVLQERTYEPVGSSRSKKANVRIISATHRSLVNRVNSGHFREDLFYRLNLLHIHLPPLRERSDDIPLMADFFVKKMNQSYGSKELYITDDARNWLKRQAFKGNVRQLKNLVDRTWLLSTSKKLDIKDFQKNSTSVPTESQNTIPEVGSMTLDQLEKQMILKTLAYYNDNYSKVANTLGITRSSLYRRLEKYGISRVN